AASKWRPSLLRCNAFVVSSRALSAILTGERSFHFQLRRDTSLLEYGDIRWELEGLGGGTRLTLWHSIDRRFISWGAAGWHIAFDVLDRLLSGTPIGLIAGSEVMKFEGWQRLKAEYAKQFGVETPNWPPKAAQKS
ncbi:MAG: hypothetical protein ABSB23_21850, partial [Bryobacteraceae bacterium]